MSRLRELQKQFSLHLTDGTSNISEHVVNNHINGKRRLQIYKNNYIFLLTDRLRALYSSVENLVGKEYFKQLAKAYIEQYPAKQSDLNAFGKHFADFLRENIAQHKLDYLADMARFEWLQTQVWQEADSESIDVFDALSQVPAEQHAQIIFILNPATRVFYSEHAIDAIFELTQSNKAAIEVNNIQMPRFWVLFRENEKVLYLAIDGLEYRFLSAIKNQYSMQEIMELDEEIPVRFSELLVKFVQLGHINNFTFT